jgi:hydrogenase nickel incorporation protein HypA/HybF
LKIAGEIASQNGLTRIDRLVVAVGGFAGVEVQAFEFAFKVLSKSTPAEGAELVIEHVPILLTCRACQSEYPAELDDLACPACGAQDFEIVQGRELLLRTITGDRDGPPPSQ